MSSDESNPPQFRVGSSIRDFGNRPSAAASYDSSAAKFLLGLFGCSDLWTGLRRKVEGRGSVDGPTLGDAVDALPDCPVRLVACRVPYVHQITAADLFNNPRRIKLSGVWLTAVEESDDPGARMGVVFSWPSVKRGGRFMIIHNYPRDDGDIVGEHDAVRLAIGVLRKDKKYIRLTIERLSDFIRALNGSPGTCDDDEDFTEQYEDGQEDYSV